MSISSQSKFCPKCGGPMPVEAPHGLCPRCLLSQASIPTEAGKDASSKFDPPTHEELVAAFPQLEILELIGQGGMGFVFKARQTKIQRLVALKILSPELFDRAESVRRFVQEARSASALNHPHILTVYEIGQKEIDGLTIHFMATELVEDVRLYGADPVSGERGPAVQRMELEPHALVFSYQHQVMVEGGA